jgi:hypothetical protein
VHDDVGDLGQTLAEGFLELAGECVGVGEGRRRTDRNGYEQDASGVSR